MQTLNVVLSQPYDDRCMQVLKRMINGHCDYFCVCDSFHRIISFALSYREYLKFTIHCNNCLKLNRLLNLNLIH